MEFERTRRVLAQGSFKGRRTGFTSRTVFLQVELYTEVGLNVFNNRIRLQIEFASVRIKKVAENRHLYTNNFKISSANLKLIFDTDFNFTVIQCSVESSAAVESIKPFSTAKHVVSTCTDQ